MTGMYGLEPVWSIYPPALDEIRSHLRGVDAATLRARFDSAPTASPGFERIGRVARIDIAGPMTKHATVLQVLFGGTSTSVVEESVRLAAADRDIETVLLTIDSPGGSVGGLAELGDAVFAARKSKRVVAQIVGVGASAAYYVASQAGAVFAQRMNVVGSIGTRMMLYDTSRLFADAGVVAIPIDTGEFKSAGAAGTEITERHREHFQSLVDSFFDDFVAAIVRGRGMSEQAVRAVGDGRVMTATAALQAGLIDGIKTLDETIADLQAATTQQPTKAALPRKEPKMNAKDAIAEYDNLLVSEMKTGKCDRLTAVVRVGQRHPKAHKAYLRATNPKASSQCFE